MAAKAALLLGSYGQTNLGDDLLMWNYLEFLHNNGFTSIYVNANSRSNIPVVIRRAYPKLHVLPTYATSPAQWAQVVRKIDCVVYGGGTVFKELYATTGRGRYAVIVRMLLFNLFARSLGARIYYLHIGLGVLKTRAGRQVTRRAMELAELSVLRDKKSYEQALALGVPKSKLRLSTDGLFMSEQWQKPWHPLRASLPGGKKVVGINLLADIPDWVNCARYVDAARQFIQGLLGAGYHVVLVPFQHDFNPNNDHVFMQREILSHFSGHANIQLLDSLPIDQAVSLFNALDAFVGMRFHSLLLATTTATPFVAVAYDTKCWRYVQDIEYSYAVQLEDLTAEELNKQFQRLMGDATAVRKQLQSVSAQQYKKGQAWTQYIHL